MLGHMLHQGWVGMEPPSHLVTHSTSPLPQGYTSLLQVGGSRAKEAWHSGSPLPVLILPICTLSLAIPRHLFSLISLH